MGRTPGDLDDIFAAADANDGKLTKEIFDEHDGSELIVGGISTVTFGMCMMHDHPRGLPRTVSPWLYVG